MAQGTSAGMMGTMMMAAYHRRSSSSTTEAPSPATESDGAEAGNLRLVLLEAGNNTTAASMSKSGYESRERPTAARAKSTRTASSPLPPPPNRIVQFINTVHPDDAAKSESIRKIRSHVARDSHARARRGRLARLDIRHYDGSSGGTSRTTRPKTAATARASRSRSESISAEGLRNQGAAGTTDAVDDDHSRKTSISSTNSIGNNNRNNGLSSLNLVINSSGSGAGTCSGNPPAQPASSTSSVPASAQVLKWKQQQEPHQRRPRKQNTRPCRQPKAVSSAAAAAAAATAAAAAAIVATRARMNTPASPTSLAIPGNRTDPFQPYARSVSREELYLIDHFYMYVVENDYSGCDHGHDQPLFLEQVRSRYLPWTLTYHGLLESILMTASRSLSRLYPDSADHAVVSLRYKGACINAAWAALSRETAAEGRSSDRTIALSLMLAAEEMISGNVDAFRLHGRAIIQMVDMRGGSREGLGPDGFLSHMLKWSVYNPKFKLIDGPYPGRLADGEW